MDRSTAKVIHAEMQVLVKAFASKHGLSVSKVSCRFGSTGVKFSIVADEAAAAAVKAGPNPMFETMAKAAGLDTSKIGVYRGKRMKLVDVKFAKRAGANDKWFVRFLDTGKEVYFRGAHVARSFFPLAGYGQNVKI